MNSQESICFVLAPIGSPDSDVRLRSDTLLNKVIVPAAKECGHIAVRADQLPNPGLITSQIIQYIANASLVVADLTGHNPNVFYELGLRHAMRKPVVQVIQAGEKIPFDTAAIGTIQIDHQSADGLTVANNSLVKAIRATLGVRFQVETPFSVALPKWVLSASPSYIPYSLVESLIDNFSEIMLTLNRGALDCKRCDRARSVFPRLHKDLDFLSGRLGMPPVNDVLESYDEIDNLIRGGENQEDDY